MAKQDNVCKTEVKTTTLPHVVKAAPQDHKPKKPTRKEMFKDYVMKDFKIMIKNEKENLKSVQSVIKTAGYVESIMYNNKEVKDTKLLYQDVNDIRSDVLAYIEKYIEPVINDLTYDKFMKIDKIPFDLNDFTLGEVDYDGEDLVFALLTEEIVNKFVEKIKQYQTQLLNCDK